MPLPRYLAFQRPRVASFVVGAERSGHRLPNALCCAATLNPFGSSIRLAVTDLRLTAVVSGNAQQRPNSLLRRTITPLIDSSRTQTGTGAPAVKRWLSDLPRPRPAVTANPRPLRAHEPQLTAKKTASVQVRALAMVHRRVG